MEVSGQLHALVALTSRKNAASHKQGLVGPQSRSGQFGVEEILLLLMGYPVSKFTVTELDSRRYQHLSH